jgi:hypothetical protein
MVDIDDITKSGSGPDKDRRECSKKKYFHAGNPRRVTMVVERLDGVDKVIPVCTPRTHILPQESQAVSVYSSSALVNSFARRVLTRVLTVGQRKKRCLQSPQ